MSCAASGIRMIASTGPAYAWNFFHPYDNAEPASGLPAPDGGTDGGGGGGGTSVTTTPHADDWPRTLTRFGRKSGDIERSTPPMCTGADAAWQPDVSAP